VSSSNDQLRLEVAEDDAGLRLDQFLATPLGSRSRAVRLIDEGLVEVEGHRVQKRYAVQAGDHVVVSQGAAAPSLPAPGPAATEALQFGIPYEDDDLLVIDKPAGVVVHPSRGHYQGTLAQMLAGRVAGGGDANRAGIVHRLDKDTSGLLVVAKTEPAHRDLKALLQSRELRREYLALVQGLPSARTGTIDAPIGRDRRDRLIVSLDTDTPREARTHFEIEQALPGVTLLRVVLETGRTHQIRVHMQAIGHPVAGDAAYGGAASGAPLGLTRQFLHAARLAFPHPVTGVQVDITSPLPDELTEALRLAGGEAS
jgi:23S rRNA pseudouridine1911/1915/1917 synthase